MQQDILTAICDRPDTWTRLLLNMEHPHNSGGCLENEELENDDRRPKNEDSGEQRPRPTFIQNSWKPELVGGGSWFYNLTG